MAAGLGFKDFVTGEVLTAADVDGYLMQGTWVFADAAARSAAVTSPQEGNMSYLKDTNSTEYYSGSAWVAIGGASGGMTLITETVASAVSSIDFNSISGSYKQLYIVWSGIKLDSAVETYYNFRFNSNSSAVYAIMSSRISGSSPSANRDLSSDNGVYLQASSVASTATQEMGAGWMLIDNYASSTKFKTYTSNFGLYNGSANQVYVLNGTFKSTTAITSLNIVRTGGSATISNDTNTTIRLYGLS